MDAIDKAKFEEQGFLIVKNVFSKNEIISFRENCYKQFEIDKKNGLTKQIPNSDVKSTFGDLLSKEKLSNIILDDRVLKIVHTILGPEMVYFGDSTFQIGLGLRGFHRDNVDRIYDQGQDWQGDYPIIRFGLYLQDHKEFSGGLKVKIGSHKNASGKSINLDIEEGDLVFWNLRTLHSGNAIRLKLVPKIPIDYFERFVPAFIKKDESKERVACFFTFGLKGKHLDRYFSDYMLKQKGVLTSLKSSPLRSDILNQAQVKKLEIVKPIPEYGVQA